MLVTLFYYHVFGNEMLNKTEYRILYVSSDSIDISGKQLRAGDIFYGTDTIHWNLDIVDQRLKVEDISTMRQKLLSFSIMNRDEKPTLLGYLRELFDQYIINNHSSSRSLENMPESDLESYLSDTFYLDEEIRIQTDLVTDEIHYFQMSLSEKKEYTPLLLNSTDGAFIITRQDILDITAGSFDTDGIVLRIEYKNDGHSLLLTEDMNIVPFSLHRPTYAK